MLVEDAQKKMPESTTGRQAMEDGHSPKFFAVVLSDLRAAQKGLVNPSTFGTLVFFIARGSVNSGPSPSVVEQPKERRRGQHSGQAGMIAKASIAIGTHTTSYENGPDPGHHFVT